MSLVDEGRALRPELIALRRALHRDPEIGFELPRTQARVLAALEGLDLEITLGRSSTSVAAVLRGSRPGPTVLLRADMDALNVSEETGLGFASTNGTMHACGHDLHVAGLVGAVKILCTHRNELTGCVLFMFEPGEEAGGGAPRMLDEGLLMLSGEHPMAAYAIHVMPGQSGVFSTRENAIMAGANMLEVTMHGRGGHGSAPHDAVDPVPPLAELILALQTFVAHRFDVSDPVVVSVTKLSAGEASNAIPDSASLVATVRTLSMESVDRLRHELPALVGGIASAHGCRADTRFTTVYPVTVNHPDRTTNARDVLRETFGAERVHDAPQPMMASEDFSYILNEVPGTFVFLFATPHDVAQQDRETNHSPRAVFDDGVLGDQAVALAALAFSHLRGEQIR